nr:NUDIX domain-containing protein [uncultured Psychroserpens sp.]
MNKDLHNYLTWTKDNSFLWEFENATKLPTSISENWKIYDRIIEALDKIPSYISPNANIDNSAIIKGNVIIEDGAQVLANSIVQGPTYIGKNCVVGNFSFIRAHCFLARNSLIGNHTYANEIILGADCRVAHFCNFSRSLIGFNSSLSAFVITATVKTNKSKILIEGESFEKRGSIIGSGTFVAPYVTFSPGIHIGNECFIGSHIVLTENIKSNIFLSNQQSLISKSNNIKIPKRKKVDRFLNKKDSYDRHYSGALIIDTNKQIVLQRRDKKSTTYNAGRIGLFGGRRENNEGIIEALERELTEELGLTYGDYDYTFLLETIFTRKDKTQTHCTVFMVTGINSDNLILQEGEEILRYSLEEATNHIALTELGQLAIVEYMKQLTLNT